MRRFFALFAILFVAVLSGCSDSTGPNASIAGAYSLRTINGASLPFIEYEEPGYREELTAEVLTVNDGGTFSLTSTYRVTDSGVIETFNDTETGTFTRNGTAVNFRFDGSTATATGSYDNNKIIIGITGFSLVYER